jgi:hypothetical protein
MAWMPRASSTISDSHAAGIRATVDKPNIPQAILFGDIIHVDDAQAHAIATLFDIASK